jgi:hypothetical protein
MAKTACGRKEAQPIERVYDARARASAVLDRSDRCERFLEGIRRVVVGRDVRLTVVDLDFGRWSYALDRVNERFRNSCIATV